MKALSIDQPGTIVLRDVPFTPEPEACVIRITAAGICGTDLQLLEGYADFTGIPGHEFAGVVDAAPRADAHWIGRRVVGEINVGCGQCEWCRRGIKEHCPRRTVVGIKGRSGAFAEYLALPARNLHPIPDGISDTAAVFVEPVAAACRILEQLRVDPAWRIAVVGDGRLGLLVAQVLKTVAHDVTVFGRHPEKIRVAADLGLVASLEATEPASYDLVVDATGRPSGLERSLALVKPRGTIVLKSTFHGDDGIELWPVAVHEVTIVGSRCGPFDRAIALIATGAVRVTPLIARTLPLEQFETAFAAARHELKILFMTPGTG